MKKLFAIVALLVLVSACLKLPAGQPSQPPSGQGEIGVQGEIQEIPESAPADESLTGGDMNLGSPI